MYSDSIGSTAEDVVLTDSGTDISARIWRPAAKPRAILAICHGLNSHSGQYFGFAKAMVARGLAVYALDLRGRGRSGGDRFYVDRIDDYVADVDALVEYAKAREGSLPVYLLGHSAGGVISCIYTLEHQSKLSGLICESFAFQVPAPDIALAILKGVSHVLPHAHVLKLHNKDFSRDPVMVAQMDADPLIAGESQPAQTVAALVRADERLSREFGKITLPVLILHGTADKATRAAGSERFSREAGSKDKSLRLYEGHFHDLLNDIGKEQVTRDIGDWIESRLP